jgi:signal peptidase II
VGRPAAGHARVSPEHPDAPGGRARLTRARAFGLAALTTALVAGIDQAAKAIALASLVPGDSVNVFFLLDLSLSRNTGIAFGALAGAGDALVVSLVAVALGALLAFFVARATRPLLWLPVGMVVGGAAGNLIDRARTGAVTDFIDPTFWPAFNLADAAIVVGVLGVLYLGESRRGDQPEDEQAQAFAEPRSRAGTEPAGGGEDRLRWPDSS